MTLSKPTKDTKESKADRPDTIRPFGLQSNPPLVRSTVLTGQNAENPRALAARLRKETPRRIVKLEELPLIFFWKPTTIWERTLESGSLVPKMFDAFRLSRAVWPDDGDLPWPRWYGVGVGHYFSQGEMFG